jgi:hypothetical protein
VKVKCIKFLSPLGDGQELDSCTYMTVGKQYIVLGVSFTKNNRRVYLEDDTGGPGYCDIRQFEIISNFIPSNWSVEYEKDFDALSLYPKSWIDDKSFFEKFVNEEDPDATKLYYKERDLIYEEEPK